MTVYQDVQVLLDILLRRYITLLVPLLLAARQQVRNRVLDLFKEGLTLLLLLGHLLVFGQVQRRQRSLVDDADEGLLVLHEASLLMPVVGELVNLGEHGQVEAQSDLGCRTETVL